jgi:hypothetical protein
MRIAPVPASPRARRPHPVGLSVVPDAPDDAHESPDEAPEGEASPPPGTAVVGSIPTVVGDRHTQGKRRSWDGAKAGEVVGQMVVVEFAPAPLVSTVGADGVPVVGWLEAGGEDAESARLFGGLAVVVVAVGVAWALATLVPGVAWRVFLAFVLLLAVAPVAVGAGWLLRWERVTADTEGGAKPRRDHFVSRPAVAGGALVVVGWWVALWWGVWSAVPLLVGVGVLVGVLVMRTSAVVVARRGVELHGGAGKHPAEKVYETWARLAAPPVKGQTRRDVSGLTGTHLSRVQMLSDGGWQADVKLPELGAETWESVAKERERIRKAYRAHAVHVGPYRTGAATHASLTVHRSDALAKSIPWARSLGDSGRVRLGWHADGAPCWWSLWHAGSGALHCLIAGSTRTGKSGLIQGLLMELLCYPHAFVIVCDPKQGKSMAHMNEHVDHLALEEDDIVDAIRGTYAALEARKRSDMGAWSPSQTWPLIALVIDEATEVLGKPDVRPRVAEQVDTIARQGAGLGVALVLGTQTYIKESLGGVGVVSNLGNIASMRMDDLEARDRLMRMLGGGDLAAIPEGDAGRGRGLVRGNPVQMRVEYAQPGDPAWDRFLKAKKPHALDPVSRRAWESVVRPSAELPEESA